MIVNDRSPIRPNRRRTLARATTLLAAMLVLTLGSAHAGDRANAKKSAAAAAPAQPPPATAKSSAGEGSVMVANPMAGASEAHPSFSVDMVMTYQGKNFTMKRTVDHGKTRMDMNAEGMQTVQIMLDDPEGTMYMLMPKEKRGMKQSRAASEKMAGKLAKDGQKEQPAAAAPSAKIEKIGQETIDGRPADKYRISYDQGQGLMWIDIERQLPLRMEAEGSTVEFKNYDFQPQPAELFQPPKGYEITDMDEMMAKMPKGMAGMPGMGSMAGGMGSMAGGMAKGYAGSMAGGVGGAMGGALGGALGGPIGSMIGQYVGQKIGTKIGTAAAGAVLPGK